MDHPIRHKLDHLLPHWIEHNASHAETYQDWAGKARAAGLDDVAAALDRAVEAAGALDGALRQALAVLGGGSGHPPLKNSHQSDEG
ncbi:hypothetical protein [Deferrisoma palaeochoriense]